MSEVTTSTVIVSPICAQDRLSTTLCWPWWVQDSEYQPHVAGLRILVNGEQAFAAVHEAIARAKRNVSLVCWGFQPSMYFVRNGSHEVTYSIDGASERFPVQIGKLLEHKARQGVKIRVLCFAVEAIDPISWLLGRAPINLAGLEFLVDESINPGRWDIHLKDRPGYEVEDVPPGDPDTRGQHLYDYIWYHLYDDEQSIENKLAKLFRKWRDDPAAQNLQFYSRGFSWLDRLKIAMASHDDSGLATGIAKAYLPVGPSHHQKSVLVDYDDPAAAAAFVMGHNMLDEYWDNDAHHHQASKPWLGRNGTIGPREDFSSQLSGPIVGDVFLNFADAWKKETGEALPPADFANYPCHYAQGAADPLQQPVGSLVQVVRTQAQTEPMRQDIKTAYYQAVNNTTSYIFVENQYFRWPPLAEKIKAVVKAQQQKGRTAPIYLFVITNSTKAGMGAGAVNTYRMLEALGRRDVLPGISIAYDMEDLQAKLGQAKQAKEDAEYALSKLPDGPQKAQAQAALERATAEYQDIQGRLKKLEEQEIKYKNHEDVTIENNVKTPGLNTHICTLVAPDSPPGQWLETYIHGKLMLVNDTFTTLGSANINTRSMEVDSEMNILTDNGEVTTALRKKLWGMHTQSQDPVIAELSAQANPERMDNFETADAAFNAWQSIITKNRAAEQRGLPPFAALRGLLRRDADRTNHD